VIRLGEYGIYRVSEEFGAIVGGNDNADFGQYFLYSHEGTKNRTLMTLIGLIVTDFLIFSL